MFLLKCELENVCVCWRKQQKGHIGQVRRVDLEAIFLVTGQVVEAIEVAENRGLVWRREDKLRVSLFRSYRM